MPQLRVAASGKNIAVNIMANRLQQTRADKSRQNAVQTFRQCCWNSFSSSIGESAEEPVGGSNGESNGDSNEDSNRESNGENHRLCGDAAQLRLLRCIR